MKCADAATCSLWTPATNEVKNFAYTGDSQGIVLMKAGRYKVELWGAQGGIAKGANTRGGYGAYASGTTSIAAYTDMYIYVGGTGTASNSGATGIISGGYNGGGNNTGQGCCKRSFGSGGGSTDIRTAVGVWNNANSLRSRIMVAAGGGGAFESQSATGVNDPLVHFNKGGDGGGINGYAGNASYGSNEYNGNDYCYGMGATQVAGGTRSTNCRYVDNFSASSRAGGFGYGATFAIPDSAGYTGGGSGWYGGGASGHVASAGGGSSYISGHTGSVAVTSTSSSSPKSGCTTGTTSNACSISPYGYTFTNTAMIDGAGYKWTNAKGSLQAMPNPSGGNYASGVGRSGNGYARITYLGT